MLLLDDVMAAVDARVAAWLLRHALLGPLLWGPPSQGGAPGAAPATGRHARLQCRPRTVIVATHSPELLAAADWVVEMQGGAVAAVRQQPEAAARRSDAVAAVAAAEEAGTEEPPAVTVAAAGAPEAGGDSGGGSGSDCDEGLQGERALPRQAEEERQTGHVRWAVYRRYAAATGWGWVALILSSLALMQVGCLRGMGGCEASCVRRARVAAHAPACLLCLPCV